MDSRRSELPRRFGLVFLSRLPVQKTRLDQGREASWTVRAAAVHRRSALTTGLNYIYKYRKGVPFHRQKGTVSPSRGYRFTVPRGYRFTVDNLRNPQGYSLPLDEGYPGLHRGATFG